MFNILFLFVIIPVLTLGALFLTHNIKQVRAVAATGASLLLIAALYLCYAFVTERAAEPDAAKPSSPSVRRSSCSFSELVWNVTTMPLPATI